VTISEEFLKTIAKICIEFETDGHRADITITRTAKTLAAFEGRNEVTEEDIKIAAKLALNHRLKKLPFEDYSLDEQDIESFFNKKDNSNEPENEKTIEAEGILARVISHEVDHLNGKLFIDRLSPLKQSLIKKKLKKWAQTGKIE